MAIDNKYFVVFHSKNPKCKNSLEKYVFNVYYAK